MLSFNLICKYRNLSSGHTIFPAVSADEATESRHMDYGHTKAKYLILCSPNSNPNQNKYLGCGYEGLVFCSNND